MSHELRTPLNAIDGYTTLMEENIRSAKMNTEEMLTNIAITQRASQYLLTIISDILDIQSIEQGKIKINKTAIEAHSYMENVVHVIRKEADEKKIEFVYERKTHFSDHYIMDGARFQQILLNILHNAVKVTPTGGKITMTAESIDQREKYALLKFVIADTGVGMKKEFLENQLFEKFAQENMGITSPYDGCGTGLFISRELIHLMGGEIYCNSEKGKGSEFVITLPAEPVKSKVRERRKREVVHYDLGGLRILLCEDNPMNQDMEKRLMERMNCVVDIADDGKIGVDKFAESPEGFYDIVLMDIRMPNMDGLEATRNIRALKRKDAQLVPILAVSANAFDEDVRDSIKSGMNEHIAKPIRPEVMYEKIQGYICNSKI